MRYQATNFLFLIISSFTVPFVHYSVLCKDKFLGCMKKFEWDSQSIKSSLTPCGHHQMSGRLWIRPERSMLKLYNFVFFHLLQEHDSFRAFRSQNLNLDLSLKTKPVADNLRDIPSCPELYASTLRFLEKIRVRLERSMEINLS